MAPQPISKQEYVRLAQFRSAMRRFVRFSESQARRAGLTPQQHQMLLAIMGMPGRDWATLSEIAEALQVNHNTVVGLVQRAEVGDLVTRSIDPEDRRKVRVKLTAQGQGLLCALSLQHKEELARMAPVLRELLDTLK